MSKAGKESNEVLVTTIVRRKLWTQIQFKSLKMVGRIFSSESLIKLEVLLKVSYVLNKLI